MSWAEGSGSSILSSEELQRFCELLYRRTGISYGEFEAILHRAPRGRSYAAVGDGTRSQRIWRCCAPTAPKQRS